MRTDSAMRWTFFASGFVPWTVAVERNCQPSRSPVLSQAFSETWMAFDRMVVLVMVELSSLKPVTSSAADGRKTC